MTKKDFTLIADVLYKQRPATDKNAITRWVIICNAFATALQATNPLFNRSRFLDACGAGVTI